MAVLTNIYPPLVPTYADPFILDDTTAGASNVCKVAFALSEFNNFTDIKHAQVTVLYQTTNLSALDPDKYPSGIKIAEVKEKEGLSSNTRERYYIEIDSADLQYGFEINTYYKVQIRFCNTAAAALVEGTDLIAKTRTVQKLVYNETTGQDEMQTVTENYTQQSIDSWLTANLNHFSEWSTVVLVRGISQPSLTVENFDYDKDLNVWMAEDVYVLGKLTFKNSAETDMLKQYRIKVQEVVNKDGVYTTEDVSDVDKVLVADSGDQYVNIYQSNNEINYTIEYLFADGKEYLLTVEYTTQNLFTQTVEFIFLYFDTAYEKLYAEVKAGTDIENGLIKVRVVGTLPSWSSSNIVFRRSSSETNFTKWEDVHNVTIEDVINSELDYTWYDKTVESGVWYRYGAQKRDSNGNRGILVVTDAPIMIDLEHAYLTRADRQLKIKFNPNIQTFSRTVSESKMDALGSKYPIIRRNGYIDYKTFPISGTISFFSDEDNLFTSRSEIYGDQSSLYAGWNEEYNINDYQDSLYEREFRDLVSDFLYDNTIKLFRSPTEGNIMVKLMNISFTPNQTLGRHLYDFSCTAYEVTDCNIQNYDKYGIQYIGDYSHELVFRDEYTGQLKQIIPANTDVLSLLTSYYDDNLRLHWTIHAKYLDYVKFIMHEPPYWIKEEWDPVTKKSTLTRMGFTNEAGAHFDNNQGFLNSDVLPQSELERRQHYISADYAKENGYLLGYIAEITNYGDTRLIVIPYDGIYELMGEVTKVTSITFPYDTNVELNYHIKIEQKEDLRQLLTNVVYEKRVGQLWGVFAYNEDVYLQVWRKYYDLNENTRTKEMMVSLNYVQVEADAGTVVYIKRSNEKFIERFIIGQTNILEIFEDDVIIEEMYFRGVYLDNQNKRSVYWANSYTYADMDKVLTLLQKEYGKTDNNITFEDLKQLSADKNKIKAIHNGVYTLKEQIVDNIILTKYIFYKGEWFKFQDLSDENPIYTGGYVLCPVDGLVNYSCEILNGKLTDTKETSKGGNTSAI